MLIETLLVAHIVVLGYWLGADLVINSTYRYVCWARNLPFDERNKLMDHVMHVDQHVRYALVLQLALGSSLAALHGYLPYGLVTVALAAGVAVAWVILLELVFRLRTSPWGPLLDRIDLLAWVSAGILLLLMSLAAFAQWIPMPRWLAIKLALFGGVFLAGVGIRVALKTFFDAWQEVAQHGSNDAREASIQSGYRRATAVLLGLWALIGSIVILSVWKPN